MSIGKWRIVSRRSKPVAVGWAPHPVGVTALCAAAWERWRPAGIDGGHLRFGDHLQCLTLSACGDLWARHFDDRPCVCHHPARRRSLCFGTFTRLMPSPLLCCRFCQAPRWANTHPPASDMDRFAPLCFCQGVAFGRTIAEVIGLTGTSGALGLSYPNHLLSVLIAADQTPNTVFVTEVIVTSCVSGSIYEIGPHICGKPGARTTRSRQFRLSNFKGSGRAPPILNAYS